MGGGKPIEKELTETTFEELDELLRRAITEENRSSYDSEFNDYLEGLIFKITHRNIIQTRANLESITTALLKERIFDFKFIYGGSIKKDTYISGLSDVDILATINIKDYKNSTPDDILSFFVRSFQKHLSQVELRKGKRAVTITFPDGEHIQVLPAILEEKGYRIAKIESKKWSDIFSPDEFNSYLEKINKFTKSKGIPIIKIVKFINKKFPEEIQLSGYHIEVLATQAFTEMPTSLSYKNMLLHFYKYATKAVLTPIEDITGQSTYVDEKLGLENSMIRKKISAALLRTYFMMHIADSQASIESWKMLIEYDI